MTELLTRAVVAHGTPFMDFLVNTDHLPTQKDEGAHIVATSWQGGGKVSTGLAAYGQLGGVSAMTGIIGGDSYGQFLVKDFGRYQVDTSRLIVDGKTAFSVILSDPVTKGRNIINHGPACRPYTLEDVDKAFLCSHKVLFIEQANALTHRLCDWMHEAGGKTYIDGDEYSEEMHAIVPKIDIFVGSEFYYRSLFGGSENYEVNLRSLQKLGPEIVVFTFSDRGCAALWRGGYRYVPGHKITVQDTLGAGDVYHGAYLNGLMRGMDPGESARFANAVAAIKCMGIGGRASIPDYQMTMDFLRTGDFDRELIRQKTEFYATFSVK
ncbi:MAG: carbohydrate kinase family protein [Christensenellaceae bacterium]|jgi:sugar/nucleoside kinase (ribokinase family)|nr:carbohydrate kinase family protein [Christensenellaceae bacterium]